jgi:hypothetical protein
VRYTDEVLRDVLRNGYHAPGMVRVNGTVRNLDAWHAAFGVTPPTGCTSRRSGAWRSGRRTPVNRHGCRGGSRSWGRASYPSRERSYK